MNLSRIPIYWLINFEYDYLMTPEPPMSLEDIGDWLDTLIYWTYEIFIIIYGTHAPS